MAALPVRGALAGALVSGILVHTAATAAGLLDTLKQVAGGQTYTVRGRVQVQDGQWLTCFDGINTGYLGAADLTRPGDARYDPVTGQATLSTAAIPTVIMTRDGTVTSNDCDSLATQGLLAMGAGTASESGAGPRPDTGYHDPYGCVSPDMTSDDILRDRREILDCQSDAITEKAWRRAQARNQAVAPAAADTTGIDTARQSAVAELQRDTAAQFQAIQSQAGAAMSRPAQNAEDLAWDGAKLCGLKPVYMMKLRDEALQFVAYDATTGQIAMTEYAGGERRRIDLDGNAFAQRASFNATSIGQGGDTCGRAFWNAEAIKAASAAMSGVKP